MTISLQSAGCFKTVCREDARLLASSRKYHPSKPLNFLTSKYQTGAFDRFRHKPGRLGRFACRVQARSAFPDDDKSKDDDASKKTDGADWLSPDEKSTSKNANVKEPEKNVPEKNPLEKIKESGAKATDIAKRILLTDEREIQELDNEIDYARREKKEDEIKKQKRGNMGVWIFGMFCIIVPVVIGKLARMFVVEPALVWEQQRNPSAFALSKEQKSKAVESLLRQEKSFQFDVILGKKDPAPSHPERLRQEAKAQEEKHRAHNRHAVANALSDFVGLIGLFIFLVINQAKFRVLLKSMSDSFYGMEPATQAFCMLLVADLLVGYHSSDGWITFLEAIFHNYGIHENHVFTHMFVATVPVTIDVMFKYWVFRYLRRLSPSTGIILEEIDRH